MSESVADVLWSMLASAGVKRCYGIVGDALNPVVDALRRDGRVQFIPVRNEEAGVFAAVAEASLTGNLVAVCGTAGPGVMHLLNGLMDAPREGVPVIAIASDTVGVQTHRLTQKEGPGIGGIPAQPVVVGELFGGGGGCRHFGDLATLLVLYHRRTDRVTAHRHHHAGLDPLTAGRTHATRRGLLVGRV